MDPARTDRRLAALGTREAEIPCRAGDPELWFAEHPRDIERAKQLCRNCPVKVECLAGAMERSEPWGVWGGELLVQGAILAHKRPRGRPPKTASVA